MQVVLALCIPPFLVLSLFAFGPVGSCMCFYPYLLIYCLKLRSATLELSYGKQPYVSSLKAI